MGWDGRMGWDEMGWGGGGGNRHVLPCTVPVKTAALKLHVPNVGSVVLLLEL